MNTNSESDMLRWFQWEHLPPHLQATSRWFGELAHKLCQELSPGPQRELALQRLLEAKDAAVRATLVPGG